jgi:uncharacterized protein
MASRGKQIFVFLLLTFAFSCLPYFLIIHSGHLRVGNGMGSALIMWCPGFAALVTCALLRIDVATLGWNWRPTRYQVWSYVIPIAIPAYATVGVISSMARTLAEEIGWRGFLFPRLAEQAGFTWGCILSGCIWAVWHYPGLLFADYNAGTTPAYALTCFTLMVIAAAFIWGWLRLKSGSLWTAVILHASHNVFIQAVFDGMIKPAGHALYVTTEFGVGLVITMWIVALYFWTRRYEVSTHPRAVAQEVVSQL